GAAGQPAAFPLPQSQLGRLTMNQTYDGPDFNVRREFNADSVAGNGTVSCRFASYQTCRLKAAHLEVIAAGTSAGAGNAAILKAGTTALATATLGSSTAGTRQTIDLEDAVLASLDRFSVTNGTDATGRVHVSLEYEHMSDAAFS